MVYFTDAPQLDERLKREGLKTHKERVEELNRYLSNLSEHHDMYVHLAPHIFRSATVCGGERAPAIQERRNLDCISVNLGMKREVHYDRAFTDTYVYRPRIGPG